MKKIGIILLNYKDYAEKYLKPCLASIRDQDYSGSWELVIVDNASSDQTYNYLKTSAPEAKIIRNQKNDGFAKGNNDALKYFLDKNFEHIFLLNMDAWLSPEALSEAVNVIEKNDKLAAVQARLMLDQDRQRINSLGNVSHFLGFGYCRAYQEIYQPLEKLSDFIAYPSGAAVLLRGKALREVGLFDEEFWMYNEDQDLGWRFWLAGWQCAVAYQSVAYHHYEFSRSIAKYYYLERNRCLSVIKNYSIFSLLLFSPLFILMEIGLLFFAWKSGWGREKMRIWLYFLKPKTWFYLFKARRQSQSLRSCPDGQILTYFSGKIRYQEIDNFLLKYLVNPIFNLYFLVARGLIRFLGF